MQIGPNDTSNKLSTYIDPDEVNAPLAEKEASGLISQEEILGFICDSMTKSVVFATSNNETGQANFATLRVDENGRLALKKKELASNKKVNKQQLKLMQSGEKQIQLLTYVRNGSVIVLRVRKNSTVEYYLNYEL